MGALYSSRQAQGLASSAASGEQMSDSVRGLPVRLEFSGRSGGLRIVARRSLDTTRTEEETPRARERSVDEEGSRREGEEEESETEEVGRDSDSEEDSDEADGGVASQLSTMQFLVRLFEGRSPALRSARQMARDKATFPTPVPMDPSCDLYHEMLQGPTELGPMADRRSHAKDNLCQKLAARKMSLDGVSWGRKVSLTLNMLPRYPCLVDVYGARAFCGVYNHDGSIFTSAVQDSSIHIYDTTGQKFREMKTVTARDVGWSILDVVYSPDQYWFAYCTWSPCVYLCNVYGEEERHYSLDLRPDIVDHFAAFAIQFSHDGSEVVAAASDGFLYIYNRDIGDRTLKIDAHQDDADAVAFADQSSQILFSAGDDGLCKVWDRRALSESSPKPVGSLAGHKDGITYIDTKGDGRYLITNSKDQTIKLWDIRKFSSQKGIDATLENVQQQSWDYRWQSVPRKAQQEALVRLPGDSSVMTYAGHMVKHTLLRCHFSPAATTGQRYIYTACARGRVIVYDVVTGKVVQSLLTNNYCNCIRDVSWHPTQPGELVSTSWDGVLHLWTYHKRPDLASDVPSSQNYYDLW